MTQDLLTPSQIVYSRRRTLGLLIKPNGDLIVRSPYKLKPKAIFDFITKKSDWICKNREKNIKLYQLTQDENFCKFQDGDLIDFKGEKISLRINHSQTKTIIFDQDSNTLTLNPKQNNPKDIVFSWLKNQAKVNFFDELHYFATQMNLKFSDFKLSNAKTKWGSCSIHNSIKLNWRLILLKKELKQYVIIHELAHITHKNHSKSFWTLVEKFDPNWKSHRKDLKIVGARLMALY